MALTEFLLAGIAEDEAPAREALEMDARFSSSREGLAVRYQSARLIATPADSRYDKTRLRVCPRRSLPKARCGRVQREARDSGPTHPLWFGLCLPCDGGHGWEGVGFAELADLAAVYADDRTTGIHGLRN